jgi:hypothetical protein
MIHDFLSKPQILHLHLPCNITSLHHHPSSLLSSPLLSFQTTSTATTAHHRPSPLHLPTPYNHIDTYHLRILLLAPPSSKKNPSCIGGSSHPSSWISLPHTLLYIVYVMHDMTRTQQQTNHIPDLASCLGRAIQMDWGRGYPLCGVVG